jgi:hypothetical protein
MLGRNRKVSDGSRVAVWKVTGEYQELGQMFAAIRVQGAELQVMCQMVLSC